MVLLQRKLYFLKDPEGVRHFPGRVQLFQGGVELCISLETHKAFDFPGGGGIRTSYHPSGSTHAMKYTMFSNRQSTDFMLSYKTDKIYNSLRAG